MVKMRVGFGFAGSGSQGEVFHTASYNMTPSAAKSTKSLLKIHLVPIFSDNYSYIIQFTKTNKCALIDCAKPDPVLKRVGELGLETESVLTTHKHWDHAGGNNKIRDLYKDMPIYGSAAEETEGVNRPVRAGDSFNICDGNLQVQVLESPCHTKGHVLYYIPPTEHNEGVIFVGDTFFVGGCGRFFEGDAQQMWNNVQQMRKLPQDTLMYCGHEYTVSNFKFASTVDPDNEALKSKYQWAQQQRAQDNPTIPSTLQEEFSYNPFFRCDQAALQKACGSEDPVQVMKELRSKKDNF